MAYPPQGAAVDGRIDDIKTRVNLLLTAADFRKQEFEIEWGTNAQVDSISSDVLESLSSHLIPSNQFVFPEGSVKRRVILLPMIIASAQVAAVHHIGIKVQINVNDAGWIDLVDMEATPPIGLSDDGDTSSWQMPVDITEYVDSGDKVMLRFQVHSDNAATVNYSTSFIVVLIYRPG